MSSHASSPAENPRRDWLGLLARSDAGHLAGLFGADWPEHEILRAPEIGAVMVRGRAGGTGAPFNLGEMTVSRCSVRLGSGEVGHGYVQGRGKDHARLAAVIDALMQGPGAEALRRRILDPLAEAERQKARMRAEKAAATRVEFFTLVRGED